MPPILETISGMFRKNEKEMPFWDHLEELRRVVLRAIGALLLATLVAYFFSGKILDRVVVTSIGEATFLRPMEAFNARLKIAFLLGAMASAPIVLWQLWGFVVPGLMHKEKRMVAPLVFWSVILFYGGIAFSYFTVTPTMLRLLIGMGTAHIRPQIAVSYLMDFIVGMSVATGILFQLPVAVAILSMIEIVTPEFLIKQWRHAVVATFILTAIVTPGDVFIAQIVLGFPVLGLYFASVLVSRAIWRGKRSHDRLLPMDGREGGGGNAVT
jgi:sec-independent protein translocase protein TatC